MNRKTRERLAEYAHSAWSGWMRYLFSKTTEVGDGCEEIPRLSVDRWTRQMNTPYENLPEEEKESDRKEADKMLAIVLDGYVIDQGIAIPEDMAPLDRALKLAKLLGVWLAPLPDSERERVLSYVGVQVGVYCFECGSRLPCETCGE